VRTKKRTGRVVFRRDGAGGLLSFAHRTSKLIQRSTAIKVWKRSKRTETDRAFNYPSANREKSFKS